jgi:uncharacterized spore protein YtfJ
MTNDSLEKLVSTLDGVKDLLTVRRVFGDPYKVDDVTIITVASVRGGGGGGGGEGVSPEGRKEGSGAGGGLGFGVNVRPVGAYVIRGDTVIWRPSIDVMRIVLGGQILGALAILTLRKLIRSRS